MAAAQTTGRRGIPRAHRRGKAAPPILQGSSTRPLTGPTPAVRRTVRRLQRNSFTLCLAANRAVGPLQLQTEDTCRGVLPCKRTQFLDVSGAPRLTKLALVLWVGLSRSLPPNGGTGPFPCWFPGHYAAPKSIRTRISVNGTPRSQSRMGICFPFYGRGAVASYQRRFRYFPPSAAASAPAKAPARSDAAVQSARIIPALRALSAASFAWATV